MGKSPTSYKMGNKVQEGNFKFKTAEERIKVFAALIEHMIQGYSLESFPPLSPPAIQDYCEKFPEFSLELLNEAKREGRKLWETKGYESLENKDFREKTYQFIMMNKYNMTLNQNSNVNLKDERDVSTMTDDELKEEAGRK